jgi:hypothetical protein
MEWNELINDVFNLECKLFMKMDSFRLIEQKCEKKCLDSNERQLLTADISYVYTRLIKTIKEVCPSLTDEDITFCCLEKAGLNSTVVSHCMGNINKQPVNQRKYRIKRKMEEAKCDFLFDMIFTNT